MESEGTTKPAARTNWWRFACALTIIALAFDALNFIMYLPDALDRRHGAETRIILWGCGAAAVVCGLVLRRLFGRGWRDVEYSRRGRAVFVTGVVAFLTATHAAIYTFLYIEVN